MNRPIYGNAATTPNLVADYNQNNPNKADYIKNRPFYEILLCICDYNETFDYGRINPTVQMNEGITLVKGEHLLFEIIEDGKVSYDEIERLGVDRDDYDILLFKSGRFYSWVEGTNRIQIQTREEAYEISVKITRPGEIKQLDEKFIPDNIKYCFDKVKLGENTINSTNETNITVESGTIQKGDVLLINGTLNGVTEEYETEVPELGGIVYGENLSANIGILNFVGGNTIWFTKGREGTKIEVYKLNKKPISEGVTELYGVVNEIDSALNRVISKYGLDGDAV